MVISIKTIIFIIAFIFLIIKAPSILIFLVHLFDFIPQLIKDVRKIKKSSKKRFRPYGMRIYCGRQGSGKTISMVRRAREIKEKYQVEQYSQYRKQAVLKYVNQLPYSKAEKMILYKLLGGYSIKDYQPVVYNYIGKLNISKQEKLAIINALYGTDYEY